jgi:hypothetical protein
MFSDQGHLDVPPAKFLELADASPRTFVNDYLLVGTPFVFKTYRAYCDFRRTLAEKLQIHPCAILVRGSARLGYSTAPRLDKAWRKLKPDSDIDVAIADVDYFTHLDSQIRQWESRQRLPHPKSPSFVPYGKRQQYRNFNCVADDWLPPNTCVPHRDTMDSFDTTPYCGSKRDISAFIFRDWWSLRNRCEFDLAELCKAVKDGTVPPPDEEPAATPTPTS